MTENERVDAEALEMKENEIKNSQIEERKAEIKKEDNKKVGLFALILIASGFIGGFFGATGVKAVIAMRESGVSFAEFWNQMQKDFAFPAAVLLIVLDLIFVLIAVVYYGKAKKLWNGDMEEDDKYEIVDKKLSLSLLYSNITYFINFAFFGFAFYAVLSFEEESVFSILHSVMRVVDLVVFMTTLFICLAIQKACVNMAKLMNPEKKGSVYDMKFDKVWYESCDEAERIQIGVAGYKTVKATNVALLILLVVFICASMFFEIGILPIVIITIMELVVNITYSVTAMNAGTGSGSSNIKV